MSGLFLIIDSTIGRANKYSPEPFAVGLSIVLLVMLTGTMPARLRFSFRSLFVLLIRNLQRIRWEAVVHSAVWFNKRSFADRLKVRRRNVQWYFLSLLRMCIHWKKFQFYFFDLILNTSVKFHVIFYYTRASNIVRIYFSLFVFHPCKWRYSEW